MLDDRWRNELHVPGTVRSAGRRELSERTLGAGARFLQDDAVANIFSEIVWAGVWRDGEAAKAGAREISQGFCDAKGLLGCKFVPSHVAFAPEVDAICILQMCHSRINFIRSCPPGEERPRSVFDATLNPNLEKGHTIPPMKDLTADAFTFIMAGTDTSANTLVIALFNLLHKRSDTLALLKEELRGAIHERGAIVEWAVLEKLPYLVSLNLLPSFEA